MFSFLKRKKKEKPEKARTSADETEREAGPAAEPQSAPKAPAPPDEIPMLDGDSSVTIYSLSTCSHCKATKKFLSECTIKYEFVDVDLLEGDERRAILEDIKKFNPRCSFPTIIIGEKVVVGFKEKEIKEALDL